jgi:hypothetical protein
VQLAADAALLPLLTQYAAELPGLFIVSQVSLSEGAELQATITRATGVKCERCWKYTNRCRQRCGIADGVCPLRWCGTRDRFPWECRPTAASSLTATAVFGGGPRLKALR